MAHRNLRFEDDAILRKKCKDVTLFDEKLFKLLDDLTDTMYEYEGVGLAAPQVGILKNVAVIDVRDSNGLIELVNPQIVETFGRQTGREGCLSFPNLMGDVTRPKRVLVKAYNRFGEEFMLTGENLLARALCHEIDHLNGILFVDLANDLFSLKKN